MENNVKASLIIAFYNNIYWLKMILAALDCQSEPSFEAIIADDGSSIVVVNQINELIKSHRFPIRHTWHSDDGWRKTKALNNGVRCATADYLIFIDGDCIPHRRFVEEHLANSQVGFALAGRRVELTRSISDDLTPQKASSSCYWRREILPLITAGLLGKQRHTEECLRIRNPFLRKLFFREKDSGILGCNFSIYRVDLMKVNGFDERFLQPFLGEDTDIEARLKRAGVGIKVMRHLLTVYHRNHLRMVSTSDLCNRIFDENNPHNLIYTPYGVVQSAHE